MYINIIHDKDHSDKMRFIVLSHTRNSTQLKSHMINIIIKKQTIYVQEVNKREDVCDVT